MANRTQSRNFLSADMGLGTLPSSSTSTGSTTQLDPLTGLYVVPGLSVEHYGGGGPIVQAKFTLNAVPVTFTDDAGQGQYGGVQIYNFPTGVVLTLGAVVDGTVSPNATSDAGTLTTTFASATSIGTVTATTGSTLVSTEADIMLSNANTAAVASVANCDSVSSATQVTESAALWVDGSTTDATPADAFLNFLVTDAAAHDDMVGTTTCVVYLTYLMLGDY